MKKLLLCLLFVANYAFAATAIPPVSVLTFGADVSGVTDATTAFSNAAKAAPALLTFTGNSSTILQAGTARVLVPPGTYTLNTLVDTYGKNIIWVLDAGAKVSNANNLNGIIERGGRRVSGKTNGIFDYGAIQSVIANSGLETGAQVMGYATDSNLGTFNSRDSVAQYVSNTAPPPMIQTSAASYTASTIIPSVPLTASQLKLLRVGMIIDTQHSPTKYSGFITGWAADGSSLTVSAWYLSPGSSTPATPSSVGTPSAIINPVTKVWAHNANVTLAAASQANQSSGFELGTLNNQSAPTTPDSLPRTWGFDSVSLGTYKGTAAFIARNPWFYGYYAVGQDHGFRYDSGTGVGLSYAGTGTIIQSDLVGNVTYRVINSTNTDMEIGNTLVASTPFIDFQSSGNNNDYDYRFIASGGTTNGTGTLSLQGGTLSILSALSVAPTTGTVTLNPTNAGSINNLNIGLTVPQGGAFTALSSTQPYTNNSVNGAVELGAKGTANIPYIDLNSSGNSNDYDVRLQASGGTTIGTGTLNIYAATTTVNGSLSTTAGITSTSNNASTYQASSAYFLSTKKFISITAPTIASGFGTSPSVPVSNGTVSFQINVGIGGTASSGVITMPAATTDWNCSVVNPIAGAGTFTQQSAATTTTVTFTNYTLATAVAVAWPASYVLRVNCVGE